mgnify:CR=1 FL=1
MIVFDLETKKLAEEVGGWANVEAMGLSVACTWDEDHGYRDWWEMQAGDLLEELRKAELIVGFNLNKFDYRVLSLYGSILGLEDKTFDILDEIWHQAHVRVALSHLAKINLGEAKAFESGVHAVRLYKQGKSEELAAYCRRDLEITKTLYLTWQMSGVMWLPNLETVVFTGPRDAEEMAELREKRQEAERNKRHSR